MNIKPQEMVYSDGYQTNVISLLSDNLLFFCVKLVKNTFMCHNLKGFMLKVFQSFK